MALWAKAQQLPQESLQQIRATYGDHFPIEVRHFLASWIEKMWFQVDSMQDSYHNEQKISNIINGLCQELEIKAASLTADDLFLTKIKLMDAAKMFRTRYSSNPMQLYNFVRQSLAIELKLVQSAGHSLTDCSDINMIQSLCNQVGNNSSSNTIELLQQLDQLKRRTQESAEDLKKIDQEHESFALQYHECTKLTAYIQNYTANQQHKTSEIMATEQKLQRQKEQIEQGLNKMVTNLIQLRLALNDKLQENIQMINQLQSRILDEELIKWRREQQLAGNGQQLFFTNLDNIQDWCESLAEIIWQNRQQILEANALKNKLKIDLPIDILPQLEQQITTILNNLVTSTFVIEKQPPQVMKTNTRFTATVRLLVGGKLNVFMTPPQVKVTIISEQQANAMLKNDKTNLKNSEGSGEILNSIGTMEYQQATRQLSVSFRNMQLKKIKRAEKKGTESVMDEKFSLLFQSKFSVAGGEMVFQVWTLSLPVVVIVHGNQEPHAWATVTWDNAFADSNRIPFVVPDKVPWSQVADALSTKFKFATGRGLTEENLNFLREKAFRNQPNVDNSTLLTWSQFCKEPLIDRNFTFWEWFYAVMKLTREHLRGPWIDGALLGFIRKKQAEEMLAQCQAGTFLLRFSDSELGGVTIAWVGDNHEVFMLQPFTSKDFAIRSLADRVSDLPQLICLFPDIQKDQAFGKYYTPFTDNQPQVNGYVKPLLVTHVPGWGSYNQPNTPHHMYMQSPDPSRDTPSVASSYMGGGSNSGVGLQNQPVHNLMMNQQHSAPGSNAHSTSDQVDFMESLDFKNLEFVEDLMYNK